MDPFFFHGFLIFAAAEMVFETVVSIRNSHRLLKEGGIEIGAWVLPLMAFLYAMMFAGSYLESLWIPRLVSQGWGILFLGLFCLAKLLKLWAVRSLGKYWTMRLLILPGIQVVRRGPYRWIRHPNYVSVLLEIVSISLLGKTYFTFACVFSLFCIVLFFRIRQEENALIHYTNYSAVMADKGRFVP